jgi:hypothetical protein
MSDDTIELIRGVNPFPADVPAPPFELMFERTVERIAASPGDAHPYRPRRRSRRPAEQPAGGPPRSRTRTVAAFAGVLLSVAVVAVVVAIVVVHRRTASTPIVRRPSAAPVKVTSAGSISVGRSPAALLSYDGSLWVAGHGYVARLEPSSGEVQARIAVSGKVVGTAQMASGAGSVWVSYTGSSRLLRIDPTTNKLVAHINLPGRPAGGGVAFVDGRVWVSQDAQGPRGDVVAINPRTDRIDGPAVPAGSGPAKLAGGLGSLWVQNTSSPHSAISQINPRTRTVRSLPFSGGPSVGFGSVWVNPEWFSGASGPPIRRYDPTTRTVMSRIRVPRATALAFGDRRVWVITYPRSRSSRLFHPIPGTATLVQINPDTNQRAAKPIHLPALQPLAIAVAGNHLWIATYAGPLLHYKLHR